MFKTIETSRGPMLVAEDIDPEMLALVLRVAETPIDHKQTHWVLEPNDTDWSVVEGIA